MNGQAKVELLLELKNKLRTGLNQAKRDTFKGVNDMHGKSHQTDPQCLTHIAPL